MTCEHEEIQELAEWLCKLVADARTVEISVQRGVRRRMIVGQSRIENEPTDGYTYTININGGAEDEQIEDYPSETARWVHAS